MLFCPGPFQRKIPSHYSISMVLIKKVQRDIFFYSGYPIFPFTFPISYHVQLKKGRPFIPSIVFVFAVIVFPSHIHVSVFPIYLLAYRMSHPTKDLATLFSLCALLIALIFPQLQILRSIDMYNVSGTGGDHLSLSQYDVMCNNGAEASFIGLDLTLVKVCPYVEALYSAFQILSLLSGFLLIACSLNILLSDNK